MDLLYSEDELVFSHWQLGGEEMFPRDAETRALNDRLSVRRLFFDPVIQETPSKNASSSTLFTTL